MRGFDYLAKRVFFAVITVFVAITLNFVLFRTLSGDAVSALRCRQCTQQFKDVPAAAARARRVEVGAVPALPERPRPR